MHTLVIRPNEPLSDRQKTFLNNHYPDHVIDTRNHWKSGESRMIILTEKVIDARKRSIIQTLFPERLPRWM